ncbi:MAG: hypothetical protein Tsb0027_25550 [Wenzhouxiangellaceae bacterium]
MLVGRDVQWQLGNLNPGDGGKRSVRLNLDEGLVAGDIVEVDRVMISNIDGIENAWTGSIVAIKNQSPLFMDWTLLPDSSGAGQAFDVSATVRNDSVNTMTGVETVLFFPFGLANFNNSSISEGGFCPGTFCSGGEFIQWNLGIIPAGVSRFPDLMPTVLTGSSAPRQGSLLRFFSRSLNDTSDQTFLTRSMLIGNLLPPPPPPDPEIEVTGNGIPIVNGDATPTNADGTDFGTLDIASIGVTRIFTITNANTGDLILDATPSVRVVGSLPADFVVSAQPQSVIASGASTTFSVIFKPNNIEQRTAVIVIPNNDNNEDPYTFSISGVGVDGSGQLIFKDGFE